MCRRAGALDSAPSGPAGELYRRNPKWTLENPLLYQLPQLGLTPERVGSGAPLQPAAGAEQGRGRRTPCRNCKRPTYGSHSAPRLPAPPPRCRRLQGFSQEAVSDEGLLALQWAIPVAARLMEARYVGMIGAPEQVGCWLRGAVGARGLRAEGGLAVPRPLERR